LYAIFDENEEELVICGFMGVVLSEGEVCDHRSIDREDFRARNNTRSPSFT
jgi:hypothetical protein